MSAKPKTLTFQHFVMAEPAVIYRAFTNATDLREYFCDVATVDPKADGRIYMAWDNGYFTAGAYTRLEPGQAVGFTWMGRDDPGQTQVDIVLEPQAGGVMVTVSHSGIKPGEAWEVSEKEWIKGWNKSLENLASVLESGEDLRLTRRPMMGILFADFNAEIAQELGVPLSEGVRLGGVVDGLSAQSAGLQKDDVLVQLAGETLSGWGSLAPILQSKRAGDTIEVVYYRGGEKKTVAMTLAQRPLPQIPWKLPELAAAIEQKNAHALAQIEQALQGVSEEEAGFQPAPGEWSIKQVLAHLINGEHFNQGYLLELVGGHERWADDYAGHEEHLSAGVLATLPTLAQLLAELKRLYRVSVVEIASLPPDYAEKRKGSYWRWAYINLQTDYHLRDHLGQMAANLEAARK